MSESLIRTNMKNGSLLSTKIVPCAKTRLIVQRTQACDIYLLQSFRASPSTTKHRWTYTVMLRPSC